MFLSLVLDKSKGVAGTVSKAPSVKDGASSPLPGVSRFFVKVGHLHKCVMSRTRSVKWSSGGEGSRAPSK